jgi:hypothetical protein
MRNPGDDVKINDVKDRWGNCKEGSIELKGLSLKSLSAVLGLTVLKPSDLSVRVMYVAGGETGTNTRKPSK